MKRTMTTVLTIALLSTACGQDDVTLPEAEGASAGACGSWYPGGDAAGDAGVEYAFAVDEIVPCFVWESVRGGAQGDEYDTFINMGELYLQYKHDAVEELGAKYGDGVQDPRAVVISVSAKNCSNCPAYMASIADMKEQLEEAGAVLIGVARSDTGESEWLSLDEADELLLEDDGWPEDLLRTNDEERHLGDSISSFPMTAIIDLETMTLVAMGDGTLFFDAAAIHSFLVDRYR